MSGGLNIHGVELQGIVGNLCELCMNNGMVLFVPGSTLVLCVGRYA